MKLTTEAFNRPMCGTAPAMQLLVLQTSSNPTIVKGLVAHFTSVKPLAQAEDDVNQRKAKAAVTNRSLQSSKGTSSV